LEGLASPKPFGGAASSLANSRSVSWLSLMLPSSNPNILIVSEYFPSGKSQLSTFVVLHWLPLWPTLDTDG
jgi:hypothetical protein